MGECLPLLTAYDTFTHQHEQLYQALHDADITPYGEVLHRFLPITPWWHVEGNRGSRS